MDIAIILVEPKRGENVGAAARAMNTMGFSDLRLVGGPQQHSEGARTLAHGSGDILSAARNYDSLAAAVEDIDFVVGTSAKDRHHRRYHHSPEQLTTLLQEKQQSVAKAAIVFGREDYGLGKDAIARCDVVSQIPLASPYPSINLAQAVMIYCYALSTVKLASTTAPADAGQYQALKPKLDSLLARAGIGNDEKTYQWAMERLATAEDDDLGFLHFICDKIDRQFENQDSKDFAGSGSAD